MTSFWKEMEQGVKCIRLVEQLLREEEDLLERLRERENFKTATTEYRIARMKYALGEISTHPNYREYFSKRDTINLEDTL